MSDDDLPPKKERAQVPMLVWIVLAIVVVAAFLLLLRMFGPGPPVTVSQAQQIAVPTQPKVTPLPDAKP